jgi:hypothetical protein
LEELRREDSLLAEEEVRRPDDPRLRVLDDVVEIVEINLFTEPIAPKAKTESVGV